MANLNLVESLRQIAIDNPNLSKSLLNPERPGPVQLECLYQLKEYILSNPARLQGRDFEILGVSIMNTHYSLITHLFQYRMWAQLLKALQKGDI